MFLLCDSYSAQELIVSLIELSLTPLDVVLLFLSYDAHQAEENSKIALNAVT
jgi:hypothetical protein